MTPRVAALALAATPLTAAPAFADHPGRTTAATPAVSINLGDASLYVSVGRDSWRGRDGRYYRTNQWRQSPWEVRQMRQNALQTCAAAIQRAGFRVGYRDVDFDDDVRARQTGRNSFSVRFDDVEFEGRRRDLERDITCNVSYGRVTSLSGIPQPGSHSYRYTYSGNSYGYSNANQRSWNRNDNNSQGRDWNRNDNDQGQRTGPGGQRTYGDDDLRGGRRPGS